MKQKIILIGGGGHCISVMDVIRETGIYEMAGIVDLPEKIGSDIDGIPVIGSDDDLEAICSEYSCFHITLGQIKSFQRRLELFRTIKSAGGEFPVIISPRAYVSSKAVLGEGSVVMHHAVVNAGVTMASNCIINSMALIEHECSIGHLVHVSTGARVNGQCRIGNGCFIGSGAVLANNITLGESVIIGAGSLVLRDLDTGVYAGNPAKRI